MFPHMDVGGRAKRLVLKLFMVQEQGTAALEAPLAMMEHREEAALTVVQACWTS